MRIAASEDVTQLLHRVVEVHLRGVLAAVGELGDLLERQIVEHAQLEHELLLRRQLRDRGAQAQRRPAPAASLRGATGARRLSASLGDLGSAARAGDRAATTARS